MRREVGPKRSTETLLGVASLVVAERLLLDEDDAVGGVMCLR
jgi:hypothetical protein